MSQSLNQQLADLHAERVATWAPEVLQVNIDQRQHLVDTADTERFVRAGDRLEPFELLKVEGGTLDRDQLVRNGAAVLVFFRFAGCPACNIAIPHYDRHLAPALKALGVPLVAISPQVPDRLVDIKHKHDLQLQVASDKDNELGRRLGILYSFDQASRQAALRKGDGIGAVTGTGTWELPQPTVVVLDAQARVVFAQVSPDWLVRTEAEPILQAVEQALAGQPTTAIA